MYTKFQTFYKFIAKYIFNTKWFVLKMIFREGYNKLQKEDSKEEAYDVLEKGQYEEERVLRAYITHTAVFYLWGF